MRQVVAGLFISLDGVTEAPHAWPFDTFDEEMAAAMTAWQEAQDAILLGRVTYQEWAEYWPNATTDLEFADLINTTPKYGVSTTLHEVTWQNSTLITGDLATALGELKAQPGQGIGVAGSPTLVHPVIAGSGKRLFADGDDLQRLRLVKEIAFAPGQPPTQRLLAICRAGDHLFLRSRYRRD